MVTRVGDLLLLGRMVESWIARARSANALRQRMQEEGRTSLTPEELEGLQTEDDDARLELVSAIADAKAREG